MNAIEFCNIKLSYKNNDVLTDVSLTVPYGKVCALIGANGCGKTSLLRLSAGLIKPDCGYINLLGNSVTQTNSEKNVSFLFEPSPLDKKLTAKQNLKLNCLIKETSTGEIPSLLNKVGLENTNKLVKNFSLGMKKRLEIAYSLIGNPKLLILDEPFDGLDIDGIDNLKKIIYDFKAKGNSVLLAEHNFPVIENVADMFAILYKGKIINIINSNEIVLKYVDLEYAYKESISDYEKSVKI